MECSITILILGGSLMQLPAIRTAKQMGWKVITADANPDVPGRKEADHFFHIDLKDKMAMESAARDYKDRFGLSGVFTAATDFSATVAWVSEKLSLPGITYQTALNASNKGLMRKVFCKAGVPSPLFEVIKKGEDPLSALSKLSLPLVIKPVDNMGSRGIRRINSKDELLSAIPEAMKYSKSSAIIIEEYIDGPEFSIDSIVEDGDITICGFADRHIYFPPYFVEMGHTIPTSSPIDNQSEVISTFKAGVRALGITNGTAKGDIKLSAKGPVIGEIAARLSGGYMSGWTYPYSSGISVTKAAMRIAVGLPSELSEQGLFNTSAERAFISIPGRINKIEGVKDAKRISSVKDLFLRVNPGDRIGFPTNNVEKCGNIISADSDRGKAVISAETACRKILIRLEPGDPETEEFLFGQKTWIPDAYKLNIPDNITEIEQMPLFSSTIEDMKMEDFKISILTPNLIENETAVDWQGNSIQEGLESVYRNTSCLKAGGFILGGLFWKAFIRGGIQGGIWLIETLRHCFSRGNSIKELINSWVG